MITKSYSELKKFDDFYDRFEYLALYGYVGESTFGYDRYLNQQFYRSSEWKSVRNFVIVRDNGCDLGIPGYDIHDELLVHHMNPMTSDDIIHNEQWILDPEYLITTSIDTHNAIHYGNRPPDRPTYAPRSRGDTSLWGR